MAYRAPFNATARQTATMAPQRSPWHSPVPYLFGGLAAMLGLIAFALLILACSYWKLSGYLDGDSASGDLESGAGKGDDDPSAGKSPQALEEKILVIMAGDARPTFIATPASSRSSSFGGNGSCVCQKTEKSPLEDGTENNTETHEDVSSHEQRAQTH